MRTRKCQEKDGLVFVKTKAQTDYMFSLNINYYLY